LPIVSLQLHKTSTSLLLKLETDTNTQTTIETIVAFGYAAEHRFANIHKSADDDESQEQKTDRDNYHLFTKFKLPLYQLKTVRNVEHKHI